MNENGKEVKGMGRIDEEEKRTEEREEYKQKIR
jgi:hypothetical protein